MPKNSAKNHKLKDKITDYICDILNTIEPDSPNATRYREMLTSMSIDEFDMFIQHIKKNNTNIHMYAPNVKVTLNQKDIIKAAEKVGVLLMEKLWLKDKVTGKKYLTPNEYLILQLPIRRVSQFLLHKMAMPESDKKLDILTGQVTGDDRSSSITQVEIQSLFARDLKYTLTELVKVRGGDVNAYADMSQQIASTGEARLDSLDPNTTARSVVMSGVFLKSAMIDNNIYEG